MMANTIGCFGPAKRASHVRVMAFDPGAAHTGYAIVDVFSQGSKPSVWAEHGKLALQEVTRATILDMIHGENIDTFAIEKPIPRAVGALRQLVETAWVGGFIAGILSSQTDRIRYTTSYDWKRLLCGNHVASDSIVADALARFSDVPKRTNAHSRDAAALAIVTGWGML
jgi:Holliday junction resolvasome RuvABC endonuclease subunit